MLLLAGAGAVVLLVAVVLLLAALWATAGAAALVVVDATGVDDCCVPKASHPPSVPTIAAVAIADFSRAANCLRRDVSGCAISIYPLMEGILHSFIACSDELLFMTDDCSRSRAVRSSRTDHYTCYSLNTPSTRRAVAVGMRTASPR